MSNIVEFSPRTSRSRVAALAAEQGQAANIGLARCVEQPRSTVAKEISNVILLLDLAAQHAREIAVKVDDPEIRQAINSHVTSIEASLLIARGHVVSL